MSWSPDLSTTGAPETGFTSPVFTLVNDAPPVGAQRQYAVSAIAGTGGVTNVRAHTAGDPFTLTVRKDPTYKSLPPKNPVTGSYGNVPMNKTEILVRKGVKIDSAGTIRVANLRIIAELPAGCETSDPDNIRGLASMGLGTIWEESADLADSYINGIF